MNPGTIAYEPAEEGHVYWTPMDEDTPEQCILADGTREHPDIPAPESFDEKICRCRIVVVH